MSQRWQLFSQLECLCQGPNLGKKFTMLLHDGLPHPSPFPALIFCRVLFKKLMVPSLSHNLSCLIQSSRQPSVENPIIILQMKNPRKAKLSKVTWLKNDGARAQIWAFQLVSVLCHSLPAVPVWGRHTLFAKPCKVIWV